MGNNLETSWHNILTVAGMLVCYTNFHSTEYYCSNTRGQQRPMRKVHCVAHLEVCKRASYFNPTASCSSAEYNNSQFVSVLTFNSVLKSQSVIFIKTHLDLWNFDKCHRLKCWHLMCQSEYEKGFPLGSSLMWLLKRSNYSFVDKAVMELLILCV